MMLTAFAGWLKADTSLRRLTAITLITGVTMNVYPPSSQASGILPSSDGEKACKALVGTALGPATIEETKWFEQGDPLLSLKQRILLRVALKGKSVELNAPRDLCQVTAKARPVPGSEITVGVWLPQPWNGKLLGLGGGGLNGGLGVAHFLLLGPVGQGYAGMATDAGHENTESAKFAYESLEALKDYGYRANQVGTDFAKALVASHYDNDVKQAYFWGCSNGGRDALMLALRSPEAYDGLIVGAPAADYTDLMSRFTWTRQVVTDAPDLGDKLQLVNEAIMAKCDVLDGVEDGLLENPLECSFDPAELQCMNDKGDNCLSTAEVSVMRKIYKGPRLPDGTQVYPGQPVGSETIEWQPWIIDEKLNSLGPEVFRWMVHRDPDWTADQFDLSRDPALAKSRIGSIVDSDDPDLSAFMNNGGKLLMYHGWNDVAIPAGATLDYFAALRETVGPEVDDQARLFMVPGMGHCAGGVGPTSFDMTRVMERWVEQGEAPDRVIATEWEEGHPLLNNATDSEPVRTRPLCPWPQVASYNGTGSTDKAESFTCL